MRLDGVTIDALNCFNTAPSRAVLTYRWCSFLHQCRLKTGSLLMFSGTIVYPARLVSILSCCFRLRVFLELLNHLTYLIVSFLLLCALPFFRL